MQRHQKACHQLVDRTELKRGRDPPVSTARTETCTGEQALEFEGTAGAASTARGAAAGAVAWKRRSESERAFLRLHFGELAPLVFIVHFAQCASGRRVFPRTQQLKLKLSKVLAKRTISSYQTKHDSRCTNNSAVGELASAQTPIIIEWLTGKLRGSTRTLTA